MKLKIFEQYIYISKKQLAWMVAIILCGAFVFYSIFSADSLFEETEVNVVEISDPTVMPTEPVTVLDEVIDVYVCGMVRSPGIYSVSKGSTIASIIKLAGGLKNNAYTKINYAYSVFDNCMINIPRKGKSYTEEDIVIRGIVLGNKGNRNENKDNNDIKININTASSKQLQEIPWVGESTAQQIIEYRKNSPFESIDDIKNVSGIGDGKFSKMKDKICV